MQIAYTGDEALLTIGTGPDHGQFDLYINDNYWRRFDAYTTTPAERVIHLPQVPTPPGETSGKLSIKVRSDNHFCSTGRVFRFKQLAVIDATYNERTIDYTYDALSRLQQANYNTGQRVYDYNFDLAGNRTQEALSGTGVTAKTTDYTYNAANQLTNDGTNTLTYDANGNLTSDGTNTYTWDRANRLKSLGTATYSYDGLGNRVSQTVGNTVTNYLLDLQPGLTKVLAATTGANTDHYIHSVRGIHAMQSNTGVWSYTTQDGLGSVRSLIDATLGVDSVQSYNPYGEPFGTVGNFDTPFAFTGEQTDPNGQLYLRARYYDPSIGVFNSLDPFEGTMARPMSLNGYAYVEGNPINLTDETGLDPFSDLVCGVAAVACAGSLVFVADNAAGVGFLVDGALCTSAATSCGRAKLLDIIADILGDIAADFLDDFLPGGSSVPDFNSGTCEIGTPFTGITGSSSSTQTQTQTQTNTDTSDEEFDCSQYQTLGYNFNFDDPTHISDYDLSYTSGIVYRGLAVGENPERGLIARSPGIRYVSPRSHNAGRFETSWISTSKSEQTAYDKYNTSGQGVVTINLALVPSIKVDLSAAQGLPSRGMNRNAAIAHQEVLVLDCIPKQAIID